MNNIYNFNPEEKRVRLAELLQDPTQPYKRYQGPMSSSSGAGGLSGLMKMLMKDKKGLPEQAPAPVVELSRPYTPFGG